MGNSRRAHSGACCRDEEKMVRCAVTALEKMKDMFGAAYGNLAEQPNKSANVGCGCVMDNKCQIQGCPFRSTGIAPNALKTFCAKDEKSTAIANGRSDRNAMRLFPGEVGLRGDRATFHLGRAGPVTGQQPVADNGRPAGAVYYNMRPAAVVAPSAAGRPGSKQQPVAMQPQRKHVMQVLPALPASTEPAVGPVTGLPIGGDEHVFVLRLGKRYDEPDEKARLQIEVRLPKHQEPGSVDADTQFAETDLPAAAAAAGKKKKGGRKGGKKSGKKPGKKAKK